MTIVITKQGTPPSKRPYNGTCGYCKTQYKCLQEDGDVIFDQRDGDFLRIKCPSCGKPANAYPLRGGYLIGQDQRSGSWLDR